MFSFQLTDELVIRNTPPPTSISFQQPARYQQKDLPVVVDELQNHAKTMERNKSSPPDGKQARKRHGGDPSLSSSSSKPNLTTKNNTVDDKDENAQRKLVHRQTERQRRQDMAQLYASLRGLLPLEFVKGKRSTSDHMYQAVNYIKDMQESIKVLKVKRDKLKKIVEKSVSAACNGTNTSSSEKTILNNNNNNNNNVLPNTVFVSFCDGGIQILINSCLLEEGFPLSRVLKSISKDGLSVNTCTCTKVSNRLIHSIQIEVNDQTSTDDLPLLQHKLTAIANNYRISRKM